MTREPITDVDVCIIGAGPAGALIADQLATSHSVVVLDAGPRFDSSDRSDRLFKAIRPAYSRSDVWDGDSGRDAYTDTGSRGYPLNHARVKGVGGSTLHWQGLVGRLHPDDFNSQKTRGVGVDWPIDYVDVQQYYAAAEEEMGVAGSADNPYGPPRDSPYPMPAFQPSFSDSIFAEACESLGIDMHSAANARNSREYDGRSQCVGYGTCQPVCPSGAKYDATVHINRAESNGAVVIDQAPVRYLEKEGDQVTAAVYERPSGTEHRQSATVFVVACGGVETPRLLLLSERANPDGFANSSGLVGKCFMDHLFAGIGGVLDRATRQNHIGFLTSESQQFYGDADEEVGPFKLEFFNYAGPSPVEIALTSDTWGDTLLSELQERYGNHIGVGALVEQLPREESFIGIDTEETDSLGLPVPRVNWSVDDRAYRTIVRANEIQEAILCELGADVRWQVGPENTGPAYHHMGTTRMGTDPDTSVVDSTLRLHDLQNCWVASSSVFPTGGAMNPTLTIAALALRVADHISTELYLF